MEKNEQNIQEFLYAPTLPIFPLLRSYISNLVN
jgi:hypothetical protein